MNNSLSSTDSNEVKIGEDASGGDDGGAAGGGL